MIDLLVKAAIVAAALAWATWPVAVPPIPAERAERCREARIRHETRRTAFSSDEVHYYCVRAR